MYSSRADRLRFANIRAQAKMPGEHFRMPRVEPDVTGEQPFVRIGGERIGAAAGQHVAEFGTIAAEPA
jgi:hypothetical protein